MTCIGHHGHNAEISQIRNFKVRIRVVKFTNFATISGGFLQSNNRHFISINSRKTQLEQCWTQQNFNFFLSITRNAPRALPQKTDDNTNFTCTSCCQPKFFNLVRYPWCDVTLFYYVLCYCQGLFLTLTMFTFLTAHEAMFERLMDSRTFQGD